jgi:hypothetical protein
MRFAPLNSIRIITRFCIALTCLSIFPPKSLLSQNAVSSEALAFLFLLPAIMALMVAPIVTLIDRRMAHPLLLFMSSVSEGIAIGIGFIGLVIIYYWYSDPTASHLEPLSLLFAAITAAATVCKKRIRKTQILLAESTQSRPRCG